jgi:hypothetical protein
MADTRWVKEFPGAVTVCDPDGVILDMNDKAIAIEGGKTYVGSNLLDCHPEPARSQVAELLKTRQAILYTAEKQGMKTLVYATPWFIDGIYSGIMDLVVDLPGPIPHVVRKG